MNLQCKVMVPSKCRWYEYYALYLF